MLNFFIRRLFYGLLVMLGVITVIFLLFNVLPGDPARMMLGQRADQESIDAIRKELALDKPLTVQYFMYLNDIMPVSIHETVDRKHLLYLDRKKYSAYSILFSVSASKVVVFKSPYLRRSYQTKRKVSEVIMESLPETVILAITSITFAGILGIFLGILSAIKKYSTFDNVSLTLAVMGMSTPSFYSGIIIAWLFGYLWCDYTGLNMTGSLFTIEPFRGEVLDMKNLILPAFTLGIRPLAIFLQLTRSSLLEVLTQDYIRTARSKGLSFFVVIGKHALKNALNPVITAISGWFASLLAGAIFVEIIFGWKGIGKELFSALDKYDFPVTMGITLFLATFFVVINIFVDIIYAILDPRVRLQ